MLKMITKRELTKSWGKAYGENFRTEYNGIYKNLPKKFSLSNLKSKWKKSYGESFVSNYPGVVKMLKPVDCRLKRNFNNSKCKRGRK